MYFLKQTRGSALTGQVERDRLYFHDKRKKFSHVTPFLDKLHWLPIQYRILFKYNLLHAATFIFQAQRVRTLM